jgi:hypothetical protein
VKSYKAIIFQSAKLGNIDQILDELLLAENILPNVNGQERIFGISGGSLTALAFGLAVSGRFDSDRWGNAQNALIEFRNFLENATSGKIRRFNLNCNLLYGRSNLNPLKKWLEKRIEFYFGDTNALLSDLAVPLLLCAMPMNNRLTFFGNPDPSLQMEYQFARLGPPSDARIVDAVIAALSPSLSSQPVEVNGKWFYDCRPAVVDAGAIVADMLMVDPEEIWRSTPYTPIRDWKPNFITSPFMMHSHHERNQALLAQEYLEVLSQNRRLHKFARQPAVSPRVNHIYLPYVGSTEAFTNMRETVANKEELIRKFETILKDQLRGIDFDEPANLIYGAGGFSGMVAGLTATRAIKERLINGYGEIRSIYTVSAGLVNGFFHAVEIAAQKYPGIYTPSARNALNDLETMISGMTSGNFMKFNFNPKRFWQGWFNMEPFRSFLKECLVKYAGCQDPEKLTFDDIHLPLVVMAARRDGFPEFMGPVESDRRMTFQGKTIRVIPAPIITALLAGASMNSYVEPTVLNGEIYRDGGGSFYDPGYFAVRLDAKPVNLINIHLNEPENHFYDLPEKPNIFRIILDQHNVTFPEEIRRMVKLTDLYYENLRLGDSAGKRS